MTLAAALHSGLDVGQPALLSVTEVAAATGLSVRSIWRMAAGEHFPAPVRLPGLRATRWRAEDLDKWLASLERSGERDFQ